MLKEKVLKTISKFQLFPRNSHILVALSGGPDSVTLLHILLSLSKEMNLKISAAHLNHKLRGEESDRDESFVRSLCKDWNVQLIVEQINIKDISQGRNIEAVAREKRYAFLKKAASELGAHFIATGHTASDLTETILLNITKGCGLKGLRGFLPKVGNIVRPLFETTREEVENYLKTNKLPFIIDSSNLLTDYQRNLIRLEAIPALKKINPSIENACLRMTDTLRELEQYLKLQIENNLSLYLHQGTFCIPVNVAKSLPSFLLREILIEAFKKLTGKTLSYKKVTAIEKLLQSNGYSEFHLGNGYIAAKRQRDLCLKKLLPNKKFFFKVTSLPARVVLPSGEVLEFNLKEGHPIANYEEFKTKGIIVRNRQPGDRVRFGNLSKSLKKLLIEKKIPADERDSIPVILVGDRIAWIPNVYDSPLNTGENFVGVRIKRETQSTNPGEENKRES